MFRKLFFPLFAIINIAIKPCIGELTARQHQNLLSTLSEELFIKNIIIIKHPISIINEENISFIKFLSRSRIYSSIISITEIEFIMYVYTNSKNQFSKTLITTFNDDFNDDIYKLMKDLRASNFMWLVWDDKNRVIKESHVYYIPYNSQLIIAENNIGEDKICYLYEIYHPGIYSRAMFTRHFGVWFENNGLKIPEKDLYKRRFDMNGTLLNLLLMDEVLKLLI